ncbi:MAG: TIGR02186 family protein [Pseudomonadota bacterium]
MRALVLVLALLAPLAEAEEIVARLSQTRIAITTGFSGSEIFIYGAVRRQAPIPEEGTLDVIVALTGPSRPVVVRKKERRFGIWINDAGVKVDAAPSFYAVSTTRPFAEAISFTDDLAYGVGIDHAVRLIGETDDAVYPEDYRRAVIRLRRAAGLYVERPGGVELIDDTLFQTQIALPAQLVEGDYRARVLLLRDKQVIDVYESTIAVRKAGLERWIYRMAQEQSLLYGLLSIAVALAAGWLASAAFRFILP